MILDKDLKEAISRLEPKEKDRLIYRLLKNDLDLTNRLYFELVSGDTKESRRKQAKRQIEKDIENTKKAIRYATPGILMMYMRETSGIINEHVKITKDKYGEVELHIFLLKSFLEIYAGNFGKEDDKRAYTFYIYVICRVFKIMGLLKKLHEDLYIDFADDFEQIGKLFAAGNGLMKIAIYNGLDVNWLINNNIPDNIAAIEKDLRGRGFLK
ncbi:MAG: hypothetical protein LBN27_07390 [Prevotellaceae bacterium]|jgi:hypothetical protein|nr:hypothetical protein [Prevotellaceae bacterium]